MAHTFQVPFSFEFRTVKSEWTEREVRIEGFRFDDYGSDWSFEAATTKERGQKIPVDLSMDEVPKQIRHRCSDAIETWLREQAPYGSTSDRVESEIQNICSDFRPRLLFISPQDSMVRSLPADAWQLRDAFLRVAPDVPALLGLLNRWGRWDSSGYVRVREMVAFQKKIRSALVSRPRKWLSEFDSHLGGAFGFDLRSTYPYFTMDTIECKEAIASTVTIDLLRKERFDVCARHDCGQPFRITSNHSRRYCSQYCGHIESVRRGREKQRSSA
jgi:hypothetical protein